MDADENSRDEAAALNGGRQRGSSIDQEGLGLGINLPPDSTTPSRPPPQIRRTPVGSRAPNPETPADPWPIASPPSSGRLTGSTLRHYDTSFDEFLSSDLNTAHHSKQSLLSSHASRLQKTSTTSVREQFDDFAPNHICNSSKHFKKGMNNWVAIAIVLLSIFSTVFSGIFLAIALHAPRYGRMIGTDGSLTISTAAFLTSLFAKMIELSFVTVVVAFLGQCLARRAFRKEAHPGVTLAEMSMRNWVSQPGTMFTHWESVRYAGFSWLGVLAVVATIMATLYTSASTALVQPQLKFSKWEKRVLQGVVVTSFANTNYIQANCKTPITALYDDEQDIEQTCISIEHASQAYHNYQHYLTDWAVFAASGSGTSELASRPKGWALFNDNTTVIAPWIDQNPVQKQAQMMPNGWVVNNITMAFPHPGVVQAAQDPANGIMQPSELNGLGIYSIRASVPSPFINVICTMGIDETSLKPLVYQLWPNASLPVNISTWPHQLSTPDPFLGGTPFDDIFEWGAKYGLFNWPPVFPILPVDYNTVANDTTGAPYGRDAIYVLGKGSAPVDNNYALCELRVGQTPHCSTQYNASSNVATLEAICDDPNDDMRFDKSEPTATSGNAWYSKDWPNIASMWVRSINMNSGTVATNSSNSRLWSELTATSIFVNWENDTMLNMNLPSPAEALAVMSGCTLLQSAQDAPFTEFWNYSGDSILDPPQTQLFNASVHQQQYASGGTANYERSFHVVLFLVFLINVIIFIYWIWHRAWYTDFSDPANLFALAINSPPSEKLADCSCGNDPRHSERFKHYWKLNDNAGGHVYMASPDLPEESGESPSASPLRWRKRPRLSATFEMVTSPMSKAAGRWTKVKS